MMNPRNNTKDYLKQMVWRWSVVVKRNSQWHCYWNLPNCGITLSLSLIGQLSESDLGSEKHKIESEYYEENLVEKLAPGNHEDLCWAIPTDDKLNLIHVEEELIFMVDGVESPKEWGGGSRDKDTDKSVLNIYLATQLFTLQANGPQNDYVIVRNKYVDRKPIGHENSIPIIETCVYEVHSDETGELVQS